MRFEETSAIATLTIRNVEPELKEVLRVRAARNGRSMEAELRVILRDTLQQDAPAQSVGLGTAIRRRFEPLGGVELLDLPDQLIGDPKRFE